MRVVEAFAVLAAGFYWGWGWHDYVAQRRARKAAVAANDPVRYFWTCGLCGQRLLIDVPEIGDIGWSEEIAGRLHEGLCPRREEAA